MKVQITKGELLEGWTDFHIWDNDGREIVLRRPDTESLVKLLQSVLALEQEDEDGLLIQELLDACQRLCNKPLSPVAECPADISDAPCICGFHVAQDMAQAAIDKAEGR